MLRLNIIRGKPTLILKDLFEVIMKKKEVLLYEVTPDEISKLPESCQVLRLDVLTGLYALIHGGRRPLECWCIRFYTFSIPSNDRELTSGSKRTEQ